MKMVNMSFREFVQKVREDFRKNREKLKNRAQKLVPKGVKVEEVKLSGSYAWGNPSPESDIDLLVRISISRKGRSIEEILSSTEESLRDELSGYGGVYDVLIRWGDADPQPKKQYSNKGKRLNMESLTDGLVWRR